MPERNPSTDRPSDRDFSARRIERAARQRQAARRRLLAGSVLLVLAGAVALIAFGGKSTPRPAPAAAPAGSRVARAGSAKPSRAASGRRTAAGSSSGSMPGSAQAPILMYHVINPPPAGAPFPGLYVSSEEFAAQMQALHGAGYVAVTLEQLYANWRQGAPLPAGKPIVLSFDNGYHSQYANALPVLSALHWPGVENIQLSGLPPSQGGMNEAEVRGLLAAGWELDTQGYSHAELPSLSEAQLQFQIADARRTLKSRYHVPVRWFCYPSGHYNAAVLSEVKAAGFIGSTTVIPGWASAGSDPYRLPRLRVLGGTSPQALLAQIQGARDEPAPPPAYT